MEAFSREFFMITFGVMSTLIGVIWHDLNEKVRKNSRRLDALPLHTLDKDITIIQQELVYIRKSLEEIKWQR